VTITLPWGSLLRGVLGLDERALDGIVSVVAPDGLVEILASVVDSDNLVGLDRLDQRAMAGVSAAWQAHGFELTSMREATRDDLLATRSSWARRLRDRPVWRLDPRRCRDQPTAQPRTSDQDGRH